MNQRAVSLSFETSWLLWRTSRFNVQKLCILSTNCICAFHMSTVTTPLSQNTLTGLCNGQDCPWCEVLMNYYVQFVLIFFLQTVSKKRVSITPLYYCFEESFWKLLLKPSHTTLYVILFNFLYFKHEIWN